MFILSIKSTYLKSYEILCMNSITLGEKSSSESQNCYFYTRSYMFCTCLSQKKAFEVPLHSSSLFSMFNDDANTND